MDYLGLCAWHVRWGSFYSASCGWWGTLLWSSSRNIKWKNKYTFTYFCYHVFTFPNSELRCVNAPNWLSQEQGEIEMEGVCTRGNSHLSIFWAFILMLKDPNWVGKEATSKIVRSFIVIFLSWILVLDKLEL